MQISGKLYESIAFHPHKAFSSEDSLWSPDQPFQIIFPELRGRWTVQIMGPLLKDLDLRNSVQSDRKLDNKSIGNVRY